MTEPKPARRLEATIALLALLLAGIALLRIVIADPLGWLGVTGSLLLLIVCVYWLVLGRTHQRLLAAIVGGSAVLLMVHLLSIAPLANVWNALSALILLGITTLAGKRALQGEPVKPSVPPPDAQQPPYAKMTLLINPKSGGGKAVKYDIVSKARALGVNVRVLAKNDDLRALAVEAAEAGAEVLAMGGGDGSLGLVAAVAMEYDLPFVCIPVGTRNHFAMDLNLNRDDPAAALAAFCGDERRIDVAMIGDRVFLNNASFGVYAAAVNEPGYREAKAAAFHTVVSEVLNGDREAFDLRFQSPRGSRDQAFVVFVGNNPYAFIGLEDIGGRATMDAGMLQITVLEPSDHDAMAKLAQGLIIGNPDFVDGFQQWNAAEFEIDSTAGAVSVGVDGEALSFATPLQLRIKPRALRVLVPPGTPLERSNPAVFTPGNLQKLGAMVR